MGQLRIRLKTGPPAPHFSEGFSKQMVREFEQGLLNKDQLQRKYGLGGNSTVIKWCRRYGKFAYHSPTANGLQMKDTQKQHIKELEKKTKSG